MLPGDTADGCKRLWDAMVRGCVPAFATAAPPRHWPILPFTDRVPWDAFALFFSSVNSTAAAQRVLAVLRALPAQEIWRRRQAMRAWIPQLVVERQGCCGNCSARASGPPPTALELALREAAVRVGRPAMA
uniref:Exostosin GT47 domain-containing protein n=1 Tax=Alexandrium monilatum TaxID=311494 RepID=A0A7S4RKE3_9DINO